ncbi:putative ADP/ATP carrier protein, bacteria [Helianthus anomalus]
MRTWPGMSGLCSYDCFSIGWVSCFHPTTLADRLLEFLGPQFLGLLAILRIWIFCVFYVMAEL